VTSIAETKKEIVCRLLRVGIEQWEAEAEAKLILGKVLDQRPALLMLNAFKTVSAEDTATIQEILTKREARVPVQYCLGQTWFMGLKILVREGVFIPRGDTETLVEVTIKLLKKLAMRQASLAEIGTGSGAVSIALLKSMPDLRLIACDISATAIAVAQENARLHGVHDRLTTLVGDWRQVMPKELDGIISNPPYIPREYAETLQPEVRQEPEAALFGTDTDGLGFFREIAQASATHLRDGKGVIAVEVGDTQAVEVGAIFLRNDCAAVDLHCDVNGLPRVVSALRQ
jgi:release factor glutamine methyltransferase